MCTTTLRGLADDGAARALNGLTLVVASSSVFSTRMSEMALNGTVYLCPRRNAAGMSTTASRGSAISTKSKPS